MRENITSGIKFGAKKIKIYAECIYIQHSAKRTTVTIPSNFCDGGRPLWFFGEGNSLPNVFLNFCRAHFFAECFSTFLPSVFLCRVFFFLCGAYFFSRVFFYFFAECIILSSVFCSDTWQRASLSSARKNPLAKVLDTWQSSFLP